MFAAQCRGEAFASVGVKAFMSISSKCFAPTVKKKIDERLL